VNIIIDKGALKLTRLQSKIGTLDSAIRPSDVIKIETLLASLEPAYKATLIALDTSVTSMKFKDIISRLRKAETRLKD
jgi:hypothetical protein